MTIETKELKDSLTRLNKKEEVTVAKTVSPHQSPSWNILRWLQLRLVQEENTQFPERKVDFSDVSELQPSVKEYADAHRELSKSDLQELIKKQHEIILSEYIDHVQGQFGKDLQFTPHDLLHSAIELYENRCYEIALLQFELIVLKEQFSRMTSKQQTLVTSLFKGIQRKPWGDAFKFAKTSEVLLKLRLPEERNPSQLLESIGNIPCSLLQEGFGTYKERFNPEIRFFTTLEHFITDTSNGIKNLSMGANSFLTALEPEVTVKNDQQNDKSTPKVVPLSPKSNGMLEFALQHPYLMAGAAGLLLAAAIFISLTTSGLATALAVGALGSGAASEGLAASCAGLFGLGIGFTLFKSIKNYAANKECFFGYDDDSDLDEPSP